MKPLFKIGMVAAILSAVSISPAFSQEATGNQDGNSIEPFLVSLPKSQESTDKSHGGKALSAGIGFPDSSEALYGRVGVGIGAFPDYEGSDDYGVTALPLADIEKPGTFFVRGANTNTNDGLASAGMTIFHVQIT